jgi:predicted nucleic acid-binding protein
MIIVLDSTPLGLVTNPRMSEEASACNEWLLLHLESGNRVFIPEIVDYEVRRELLRAGKTAGLARLNQLQAKLEYIPLTTSAMRKAAELWATARRQGQPTASDAALDGDVILAAQTVTLETDGDVAIIATANTKHLARFTRAYLWKDINIP